jgi:hypothetical protein
MKHQKMLLVDTNGKHNAKYIDYDGRTYSDKEAINLPNYHQLSRMGIVRHWTVSSGHTGFFVLINN